MSPTLPTFHPLESPIFLSFFLFVTNFMETSKIRFFCFLVLKFLFFFVLTCYYIIRQKENWQFTKKTVKDGDGKRTERRNALQMPMPLPMGLFMCVDQEKIANGWMLSSQVRVNAVLTDL
jgi:hypothetical protein